MKPPKRATPKVSNTNTICEHERQQHAIGLPEQHNVNAQPYVDAGSRAFSSFRTMFNGIAKSASIQMTTSWCCRRLMFCRGSSERFDTGNNSARAAAAKGERST
jgi:hypothetical protein